MWQSLTNQYPGGELPPGRPPRGAGPPEGAGQRVTLAGQIPGREGGSDPGEAFLGLLWVA